MIKILINKERLIYDDYEFKCVIGKNGRVKKKKEGDKKTPVGTFSLGNLFYRYDRKNKPETKLKCTKILKNMGWCDDPRSKRLYNKLIKINKKTKVSYEKLFRNNSIYDYLIPINYNTKERKPGKGSAIFLHITKNFKKTQGCVALQHNDFLILAKIIDKNTKIKIL